MFSRHKEKESVYTGVYSVRDISGVKHAIRRMVKAYAKKRGFKADMALFLLVKNGYDNLYRE